MKKYIAWAESEANNELWFLIDAENEEQAKKFILEEKEVIEIRACLEIKPNASSGISHRFTINE